jgi:hypothetical protein
MATSLRPKRLRASGRNSVADEVIRHHPTTNERGQEMIEYKGFMISEGTGSDGEKIYRALRNQYHAIASNESLARIVQIIDEKEGK